MSASTSATAALESLFPEQIEPKSGLRTVPSHHGRPRALPGARSSKTTTFGLTDLVENVLEALTSGGYGASNGATVRRAFVEVGLAELGEEEMTRLGWTPSMEETPKA